MGKHYSNEFKQKVIDEYKSGDDINYEEELIPLVC